MFTGDNLAALLRLHCKYKNALNLFFEEMQKKVFCRLVSQVPFYELLPNGQIDFTLKTIELF